MYLLFLLAPQVGRRPLGPRVKKLPFRQFFATYTFTLLKDILSPPCSRPTERNKKLRAGINPALNSLAPQVGLAAAGGRGLTNNHSGCWLRLLLLW